MTKKERKPERRAVSMASSITMRMSFLQSIFIVHVVNGDGIDVIDATKHFLSQMNQREPTIAHQVGEEGGGTNEKKFSKMRCNVTAAQIFRK